MPLSPSSKASRKKAPKSKKSIIVTPTEAQYVENRLNGLTPRQAIAETDYDIPHNGRSQAMAAARRIEGKLAGNPGMIQAIEQSRVTRERLAGKLSDLLDAQNISFGAEGKVIARPDNTTQLKALEMSIKIFDGFPAKQVSVTSFNYETSVQILADIRDNPDMVKRLMQIANVPIPAEASEVGSDE